jgi:hypothetical protein
MDDVMLDDVRRDPVQDPHASVDQRVDVREDIPRRRKVDELRIPVTGTQRLDGAAVAAGSRGALGFAPRQGLGERVAELGAQRGHRRPWPAGTP